MAELYTFRDVDVAHHQTKTSSIATGGTFLVSTYFLAESASSRVRKTGRVDEMSYYSTKPHARYTPINGGGGRNLDTTGGLGVTVVILVLL